MNNGLNEQEQKSLKVSRKYRGIDAALETALVTRVTYLYHAINSRTGLRPLQDRKLPTLVDAV